MIHNNHTSTKDTNHTNSHEYSMLFYEQEMSCKFDRRIKLRLRCNNWSCYCCCCCTRGICDYDSAFVFDVIVHWGLMPAPLHTEEPGLWSCAEIMCLCGVVLSLAEICFQDDDFITNCALLMSSSFILGAIPVTRVASAPSVLQMLVCFASASFCCESFGFATI